MGVQESNRLYDEATGSSMYLRLVILLALFN
jgi:hypothetical protein